MNRILSHEPTIDVGLALAQQITIDFNGVYRFNHQSYEGVAVFSVHSETGSIVLNGQDVKATDIFFEASHEAVFTIKDVLFGIGFHWQRSEDMTFPESIRIFVCEGKIQVVNRVRLEVYLQSVISSEMNPHASDSLLKAHAVISRSWLIKQLLNKVRPLARPVQPKGEHICFYDREDHEHYDVCGDDHCQRYQGVTRIVNDAALKAVAETCGQVLMHEGSVCDARFSKCCGGATEQFSSCWDDADFEYLQPVFDRQGGGKAEFNGEDAASEWIKSSPEVFCNTSDPEILRQVLNDYDLETRRFFRWEVTHSGEELGLLLKQKTGIEVGEIIDLQPLTRGASGRITRLKIIGSTHTIIIGKELEIRRALSETHLLSSAFVVNKNKSNFTLKGAGWGHGVGLCQIGAAVMGAKGYDYTKILTHYFTNATIEKYY